LRVIESMDNEEWNVEFIDKGGAQTLMRKLDHNLRLVSDIEIDYLNTLTKLMVRYYSNQPTDQP
jgi:hypothetical protein